MTTTQDPPPTGTTTGPGGAPGRGRPAAVGQEIPRHYRLDHTTEAFALHIFDQQLTTLTTAEHHKSLLAHREITALVTAHRYAYTLLPAGSRPGAPRPHAPGSTDRGDTWLQARELVLSEYAPACSLSIRTAAHRFDQALDAAQYYPDTLSALTDPDSGITPQKLIILIRETRALTIEQKRAVETIVLPHAPEDTNTAWTRRIRAAIITVLGAPLAAKIRRRREEDRYLAIIPDGMIAHLLGDLPLPHARALDLALDALADTADADDPRTHAQRRIDALLACVLGPAVFHTHPAKTTNHRTDGDSGRGRGQDNEPGDTSQHRDDSDAPAWPAPRDEDEPVADYDHGQSDDRDIDTEAPTRNTNNAGSNDSKAETENDEAEAEDETKIEPEADVDLDADEQNPYRALPLPVFDDRDEPQPDPHAPDNDDADPLTRALWDPDDRGVFALIDPAEAERVTELWDLIRQLAAHINLTIPTPPEVHLDVTIPVDLLAGSDHATNPDTSTTSPDATRSHARNDGSSLPPAPGSGDQPPGPDNQVGKPPGDTSASDVGSSSGSDPCCPHTGTTRWRAGDLIDERHAAIIDGIGPVDPDLARHLAADARWRRVLHDPITGIVYDVGKTRYRPPADMRRRVITRDVTCRFPGCARTAAYCHLDHVIEYPNGPTADTNLIALCELHHRVKHQTGWQLVLHDDASIDWTSPTGRRYTTHPPGRKTPPRRKRNKKNTAA